MRNDGAIVLEDELGVVGRVVWRVVGGDLVCGHLEAEHRASWR